jgi:hypothetical protein
MVESRGHLEAKWVLSLDKLAVQVCATASAPKVDIAWLPFLKRTCIAGAGALLTMADLLAELKLKSEPEPLLKSASNFLRLSVGGGIWVIGWAATSTLDKLVDLRWTSAPES